jgi:hypothetical protein
MALMHSLPVNRAKLKNESATTKKEIAIARRCGFLLLIKLYFGRIIYRLTLMISRLTVQFKMN